MLIFEGSRFSSHSHELHESKLPFVPRTGIIRSKRPNLSAHVSGVSNIRPAAWRLGQLAARYVAHSSSRHGSFVIRQSRLRLAGFGLTPTGRERYWLADDVFGTLLSCRYLKLVFTALVHLPPPHTDAFSMRCVAIRHDASKHIRGRIETDRNTTDEKRIRVGRT